MPIWIILFRCLYLVYVYADSILPTYQLLFFGEVPWFDCIWGGILVVSVYRTSACLPE